MKTRLNTVIVAIALVITFAGASEAQLPLNYTVNVPKTARIPDGGSEVPLLLLGRAPGVLPVVEVMLNGHGPFRFGIETGAQFIGMRPGLADSLKLAKMPDVQGLPTFHLDSIGIGAAVLGDVPVSEIRTAATDIDGFLGFPTFRDVLLTIDYPAQKLRIARGALPSADDAQILNLKPVNDGDFLGVGISIEGRPFTAVIDTRSTGGVQLTPESATSLKFSGDLMVVGMARGAAIGPTEVKAGTLAGPVMLGRYTFANPEVAVRPLPPGFPTEPLLGTLVLQKFAVTIDHKNARVQFSRDDTSPIELPRRRPPGGG